jgi:transposase
MDKAKHTLEFKKQALGLAEDVGVARAAKDLGVTTSKIYHWRSDLKEIDLTTQKDLTTTELEELKKLRRENNELKKINHILKSAAAFFSQDHLK